MKSLPIYIKIFFSIISVFLFIVCSAFLLTKNVTGKSKSCPAILNHQDALIAKNHSVKKNENGVITLLSLNIAHGRSDGVNQIFQNSKSIKSNLDEIISLLKRETPDIIALQEADGPSIWSGNFSHVTYLAEKAGYNHSVRGEHVSGMRLSYGTALLSKNQIHSPVSVTFSPSPPTFSKGFLSVSQRIGNDIEIDIISVHLDFSRKEIRQKQVQNMINKLSGKNKPLIIMGDFNCEWEKNSAVKILAEKLNLSTYQVEENNQITFPALKKRIDFILISNDFEFITHEVLPDIVSDHLGVLSTIKLKARSEIILPLNGTL
jgi:endonuclease/exonuclease/phosphatase family metal-dependent hydrolase